MEIRRFYVDTGDISDGIITVKGDEFVHMTKILRHKVGYKIVVNNNFDGYDYYAVITDIGKDSARAEIVEKVINDTDTSVDITLMQALPKGDKSDFIAQKATELGIKKIIFFISEFTAEKKFNLDRIRRITLEACKQCGRAFVPSVETVYAINELPIGEYDKVILMNEHERKISLSDIAIEKDTAKVALIVGSEGGFSTNEVSEFMAKGALSVSLGKRILRAETASIVAMSIVMYKLGEMDINN